jgi:hypothetical protein
MRTTGQLAAGSRRAVRRVEPTRLTFAKNSIQTWKNSRPIISCAAGCTRITPDMNHLCGQMIPSGCGEILSEFSETMTK